jgi:hypothetical protein
MRNKYGRARQAADIIVRRMRLACSITKNTDALPGYVILFIFLLKDLLGEGAPVLCYTYTVYLVYSVVSG